MEDEQIDPAALRRSSRTEGLPAQVPGTLAARLSRLSGELKPLPEAATADSPPAPPPELPSEAWFPELQDEDPEAASPGALRGLWGKIRQAFGR